MFWERTLWEVPRMDFAVCQLSHRYVLFYQKGSGRIKRRRYLAGEFQRIAPARPPKGMVLWGHKRLLA